MSMYFCDLYDYDDYFDQYEQIYDSWVVDECEERIYKCDNYTSEQINDILVNHPEYKIRTLPRY